MSVGAHTDLSKAYEGVNLNAMETILRQGGIPQRVVTLLMGTYRAAKWVTYAGCSVKARCGIRGLPAGCPAAIVAMSAYTATLSLRLRERQGLFHRFYLDDFTMTHFAP
eukprot:6469321-Amphidinium_carterae.1